VAGFRKLLSFLYRLSVISNIDWPKLVKNCSFPCEIGKLAARLKYISEQNAMA
jgi:hypothetical protein